MRYFTTEGRINRWKYFLQILPPALFGGVGVQIMGSGNPEAFGIGFFVAILANIIAIFPSVRRLHDINASGWWFALSVIPAANFVLGLVLLFMKGAEGENHYGSDPLESQEAQGKENDVRQSPVSSSSPPKSRQKTHGNRIKHRQSGAAGFDPDEHKKKCPFCAEYIKLEALGCRYCGHEFSDEEVERQIEEIKEEKLEPEQTQQEKTTESPEQGMDTGKRYAIAIATFLVLMMVALLIGVLSGG